MPKSNRRFDDTNTPLVTVVTPSYNQGAFIERTILSVLRQDYPNIEYIVMDAMSKDETPEILKRYQKQITAIVREKDSGQADALNKGFARSSGSIMAYLNSDDCYAGPSVVSDAVSCLLDNEDVDVAYGRRIEVDEKGFYAQGYYPFAEFSAERLKQSCYLPQECCFWRRTAYEKAGNCIDTNFKFALDYDLWMRFLDSGANFKAIDKVFGLFRLHNESKTSSAWLDVGYPEARALTHQNAGRPVPLLEMYDIFFEHYMGVSRQRDVYESQIASEIWWYQQEMNKETLTLAPLDYWVYCDFWQN